MESEQFFVMTSGSFSKNRQHYVTTILVMYPASPAMPNWEGHHARAEIYPKPDDLQSTAVMPGDLMFNYRDARMTYTPIPGINTKCQWQDQTPGSPRAHRPRIKEVEWSIEVQSPTP